MLNILIVDDEKNVLDGMKYLFEHYIPNCNIVAAVRNPIDVFNMIENESINLVFTDVKMPGISGVELTQELHKRYPSLYIVILSAFSDFDFVRKCLLNGAYDYLIKPPSPKAILEITNKIEISVMSTKKKEDRIKESKKIRGFVINNKKKPNISDENIQVFVCLPHSSIKATIDDLASIINIVEGFFPNDCFPFQIEGYIVVISYLKRKDEEAQNILSECIINLRHKGYPAHGTYVNLKKEQTLYTTIKNCQRMIDFSIFNHTASIITEVEYQEYIRSASKNILVSDYISGKQIVRLITTEEVADVDLYLSKGFEKLLINKKYIQPEQLRVHLIKELFIIANEFKGFDLINLEDVIEQRIFPRSRDEVPQWFCDFIIKIIETTVGFNIPTYVQQTIKFINQNYMNNITLKEVAQHIHINPWYLSTQFKKAMSIGFTEYLNQVRVDAAKALLAESDLKIYQVSEMIGFQEPTYFNTVFKKMEGVCPSEYQIRFNSRKRTIG